MEKVKIGKLLKPFGIDGHLKFDVNDVFLQDFLKSDVVFLNVDGSDIPYFIDDFSKLSPLTVKFEEVDSKESASKIGMCSISLKSTDISENASEIDKLDFQVLIGYDLYDGDSFIGNIEDVVQYPQQIMAIITVKKCQVLIPLPDEFIKDIDSEKNVLYCTLPDGIVTSQLN